jgi:sec-independent protein translocase protein TatA
MISPQTGVIVLLIVLLLFGGKKIPEIMGSLGKGLRIFKKTLEGEDIPEAVPPSPTNPSPLPPTPSSGMPHEADAPEKKIEPK